MTVTELISHLKDIYKRHGDMVVITNNTSGTGNIDQVSVEFDMIERRNECVLAEALK